MLTNLFVNTKAYPFTSLKTTLFNLKSTLIGWKAVNFRSKSISKPDKIYPILSALPFENLKSSLDMNGWRMSSFVDAVDTSLI